MYQSRKRKYTSRQERYQRSTRFLKIMAAFALVGGVLLLFFRWQIIWDWIRTFSY